MADLKNYVRFSEKKDVQIKQNMKYALSGYKFLKENVFNYTHTMYYFDNCQRPLKNVVFWPFENVGFRPLKMLVFGPRLY